jgi:uridine kinase
MPITAAQTPTQESRALRNTSSTSDPHKALSRPSTLSSIPNAAPHHSPLIILIAGGQASGKRTVLSEIKGKLLSLSHGTGVDLNVTELDLGDFRVSESAANPEGPEAFDLEALSDLIEKVKDGEKDASYECQHSSDLEGGNRLDGETVTAVGTPDVLLVQGAYTLFTERLRGLADVKVTRPDSKDTVIGLM